MEAKFCGNCGVALVPNNTYCGARLDEFGSPEEAAPAAVSLPRRRSTRRVVHLESPHLAKDASYSPDPRNAYLHAEIERLDRVNRYHFENAFWQGVSLKIASGVAVLVLVASVFVRSAEVFVYGVILGVLVLISWYRYMEYME